MNLTVTKYGNQLGTELPQELLDELQLVEGARICIERVGDVFQITVPDPEFNRQIAAFHSIEQKHRNTFRELAKGPGAD